MGWDAPVGLSSHFCTSWLFTVIRKKWVLPREAEESPSLECSRNMEKWHRWIRSIGNGGVSLELDLVILEVFPNLNDFTISPLIAGI